MDNNYVSKKQKGLLFVLTVALLAISVLMTGCAIGEKAKIKKILTENGSVIGDFDVVTTVDLAEDTEGLQGKNSLVLCRSSENQTYGLTIVDKTNKSVTDLVFEYKPQNIIVTEIFNGSEAMNVKNTELIAEYISKDGVECFLNQDIAEEYIREVTGEDSILSGSVARQAIIDSVSYIIPEIGEYDDYTVIFEDLCANPMYYAAQGTEKVYNWGHLWPEYQYEFVCNSLDQATISSITYMHGPAYSIKPVWVAVDKNLKKVGTFDSKEAMEKKLKSDGTSSSSSSKKTTSAEKLKMNSYNKKENISSVSTTIPKSTVKPVSATSNDVTKQSPPQSTVRPTAVPRNTVKPTATQKPSNYQVRTTPSPAVAFSNATKSNSSVNSSATPKNKNLVVTKRTSETENPNIQSAYTAALENYNITRVFWCGTGVSFLKREPYISDESFMVPLDSVVDAIKCEVSINEDGVTLTTHTPSRSVTFSFESKNMIVDGETVEMKNTTQIKNKESIPPLYAIFVPLEAIAYAFDCEVTVS